MSIGKAVCVVGLGALGVWSEIQGHDGSGWGLLAFLVLILA